MVFIKPTKKIGVFRLILDHGENWEDLFDAMSEVEWEAYQVITHWNVYDKTNTFLLNEEEYDFLGYGKVRHPDDFEVDFFHADIEKSRRQGFRLGRYELNPRLKDMEIKLYGVTRIMDIEIRDAPI